ncbi:MAG: flagellar biosynthetic protein FliO [Azospirillaceae bacterium]
MDLSTYLRFALALIFVLALIGALAFVAKRFGWGGAAPTRKPGSRRRLSLVESLPLDAKRRLVLLRCDDTEHLVLIGASQDVVVGNPRPASGERSAAATDTPAETPR